MCVDIVAGCMGCLSLVNVHSEERYALPGVGMHLPRDLECVSGAKTQKGSWCMTCTTGVSQKKKNSNNSQEHERSG